MVRGWGRDPGYDTASEAVNDAATVSLRAGWRRPTQAFAMTLALLLTGCAHVFVGADGSRNVIGLVWLTLPTASASPAAAEAIRTRSLGLTLTLSEAGNALTLGYSDATLAFVRDNAEVSAVALLMDTEGSFSTERGVRR